MSLVRTTITGHSLLCLLLAPLLVSTGAFHLPTPSSKRQSIAVPSFAWNLPKHDDGSRRVGVLSRTGLRASVEQEVPTETSLPLNDRQKTILESMRALKDEALDYAEQFELSEAEAALYALFLAIRRNDFVKNRSAFVLRREAVEDVWSAAVGWSGFFDMGHLEKALDDDFLDAARGSTDNRKGWQITDVSVPRGQSFEEARMSFDDVQAALEKGTVIFNAAGAHIPKLAGPTLACSDAMMLPCALNLYVTAAGKRTSAPPHTDKQDVVVIQTSGTKHWRVYTPPNPASKPHADMFARGKMDDSLPFHLLETDLGCERILETDLYPGDVLFIPAGYPHTTSTVVGDGTDHPATKQTSIHLTMGIDHHIWGLDYLTARRLALRRAGVRDTALGKVGDEENYYTGACNELETSVHERLFAELPLGLLDEDSSEKEDLIEQATAALEKVSYDVDSATASKVSSGVWKETLERVRQQGVELLDIHRDMYLAAVEEGSLREAEDAMTAHLDKPSRRAMTPERMQRLSLFRVKRFFDMVTESKNSLTQWSYEGNSAEGSSSDVGLPADWAFTMPVNVGAQVEADLGGALFAAKVTRASGGTYDVQFFDGDRETNLDRSQIKLLTPPVADDSSEVDTSQMTPKELKRWRKAQEKKLKKKKGF